MAHSSMEELSTCLNNADRYGNTPLELACIYNEAAKQSDKRSVVRLLLQYGASPITCNLRTQWTPMHWAARYGDVETLRAFISNQDSTKRGLPHTTDKRGLFPIDYAGLFGHDEAVRLLAEYSLMLWEEWYEHQHDYPLEFETTIS